MTISITPLDCGSLTAAQNFFVTGGSADPVELPVPAWLIHHPRGTVLFDTGMSAELTSPGELLDTVSLFFSVGITEDQLVAGALRRADVDPSEIDIVVLSHLHFDHTGGLAMIPDARVVIQADEWAAGGDDGLAAANSFRPAEYQLGHDVQAVDGAHDLFGDGSVLCIPTPGHTPGHQSLRVRLADREIVLAADCAYFADTLDGGGLPPIGHDHDEHARSIERLRDLRSAGATIIPGHDRQVFDSLPATLV